MKNRWSDAARAAALAVRKARAFAANPQDKGKGVPKRGGLARKPFPMVRAGGSAAFDERTGTRNNPEKLIWIPRNGGKGTQYEEGMKGLGGKKLLAAKPLPKPNIFYSSAVPGPLDRQTNQGILRYDPKNPLDASKLGYNMGSGKKIMPPMPPKPQGPKKTEITDGMRYIIGGKRYTRVGNKLVPDEFIPGQKKKVFYEKR